MTKHITLESYMSGGARHFEGGKNPNRRRAASLDSDFREYRKTQTIYAVQIPEPFTVTTLEGLHTGKKGDWLAVGAEGEMYPIDQGVFGKTYEAVDSD